jgi:hypothetical protein
LCSIKVWLVKRKRHKKTLLSRKYPKIFYFKKILRFIKIRNFYKSVFLTKYIYKKKYFYNFTKFFFKHYFFIINISFFHRFLLFFNRFLYKSMVNIHNNRMLLLFDLLKIKHPFPIEVKLTANKILKSGRWVRMYHKKNNNKRFLIKLRKRFFKTFIHF